MRGPATPSRITLPGAFALRAAANAEKFAMDPPLVNSPSASGASPSISFSQLIVMCSNSVPAGADRQHVRFAFTASFSMLPSVVTAVPGDDT